MPPRTTRKTRVPVELLTITSEIDPEGVERSTEK